MKKIKNLESYFFPPVGDSQMIRLAGMLVGYLTFLLTIYNRAVRTTHSNRCQCLLFNIYNYNYSSIYI